MTSFEAFAVLEAESRNRGITLNQLLDIIYDDESAFETDTLAVVLKAYTFIMELQ